MCLHISVEKMPHQLARESLKCSVYRISKRINNEWLLTSDCCSSKDPCVCICGVCITGEPQVPGVKNVHSRETTWDNSSA